MDNRKVLGVQTNEFKGLDVIDLKHPVSVISFDVALIIANCPETGQRDNYRGTISLYPPDGTLLEQTIETKSLKLYLETFTDQGVFAEDLAGQIASELFAALLDRVAVVVNLVQGQRGGIEINIVAQRGLDYGQHKTE